MDNRSLQRDTDNLKSNFGDIIDKLIEYIEELESDNSVLTDKVSELESKIEDLESQLWDLRNNY
jgi:polyhydroxyalkanoate synthesis regulator phasin